MNLKTAAISLALLLAPCEAITGEAAKHPGIFDIIAAADSIEVSRLGEPFRHCELGLTDSLRYTLCYSILESGVARREDWRADLGTLLGSRTIVWNHDSCGYQPQALVRFASPEGRSNLVVFTSRCDSSRVGLLMIQPSQALEHVELADSGGRLLDLLAEALPDLPPDVNPFSNRRVAHDDGAPYDVEPTPITRVEPSLPSVPRGAEMQGPVVLNVLVGVDGRVKEVKVIRGAIGLNEAAVSAARQWLWNPARSKGRAVAAWVELSMEFHAPAGNVPSVFPPFPWGGGRRIDPPKSVTPALNPSTR